MRQGSRLQNGDVFLCGGSGTSPSFSKPSGAFTPLVCLCVIWRTVICKKKSCDYFSPLKSQEQGRTASLLPPAGAMIPELALEIQEQSSRRSMRRRRLSPDDDKDIKATDTPRHVTFSSTTHSVDREDDGSNTTVMEIEGNKHPERKSTVIDIFNIAFLLYCTCMHWLNKTSSLACSLHIFCLMIYTWHVRVSRHVLNITDIAFGSWNAAHHERYDMQGVLMNTLIKRLNAHEKNTFINALRSSGPRRFKKVSLSVSLLSHPFCMSVSFFLSVSPCLSFSLTHICLYNYLCMYV